MDDPVYFNGNWYHRSNAKNFYRDIEEDKKWERIKDNIKHIAEKFEEENKDEQ